MIIQDLHDVVPVIRTGAVLLDANLRLSRAARAGRGPWCQPTAPPRARGAVREPPHALVVRRERQLCCRSCASRTAAYSSAIFS